MCNFELFQYLCMHEKLKIVIPCNKAFADPHGVLTCPDILDRQAIDELRRTYGLGVCPSIHCAWNFGILPVGDYGDERRFGKSKSFEDDTEIEDSPAAREERVSRWYRLLDADQQLDHYQTEYPIPDHELSLAGRAIGHFPTTGAVITNLDTVRWQELNPTYLTPVMLQSCVFHRLLPASVVDDRKSKTITPRLPMMGPFRPKGPHKCPERGICKVCGANIGNTAYNKAWKEETMAHRQLTALSAFFNENPADWDMENPAWDPTFGLKWDDDKGEYRKVPSKSPVNVLDAPYPASSNPAFVPSTTQGVDTAAVLGGQDVPLADSGTYASLDGLAAGMDWEGFAQDVTLDNQTSDFLSDPDWLNSDFSGIDGHSTIPQADFDMNDFILDTGIAFGADLNSTSGINANHQAGLDFGFPPSQFDTFTYAQPSNLNSTTIQYSDNQDRLTNQLPITQHTNEPFNPATNQSKHSLFSNPNPFFQAPGVASPDLTDDPMTTPESGGARLVSDRPTGDFTTEQAKPENALDGISPETLNLTQQMLRQASNGGVARPSNDPAANALFEQVMQFKRAGLV